MAKQHAAIPANVSLQGHTRRKSWNTAATRAVSACCLYSCTHALLPKRLPCQQARLMPETLQALQNNSFWCTQSIEVWQMCLSKEQLFTFAMRCFIERHCDACH